MPKLRPNQFYLPCGALITELPILFQTDMVKANLEDRKTRTRRTRGLNLVNLTPHIFKYEDSSNYKNHVFHAPGYENTIGGIVPGHLFIPSPYGKPGDLLWVKETWGRPYLPQYLAKCEYLYKADSFSHLAKEALVGEKWKPSIHMPKEASRIWLMVEDIRVERLQDISEEDAIAEGIGRWVETRMKSHPTHYKVYTDLDPEALYTSCPKDSFETLWISINGEESWDANPWVWVIKYRILSKTGRPSLEVIEKNYLEVKGKEVANG